MFWFVSNVDRLLLFSSIFASVTVSCNSITDTAESVNSFVFTCVFALNFVICFNAFLFNPAFCSISFVFIIDIFPCASGFVVSIFICLCGSSYSIWIFPFLSASWVLEIVATWIFSAFVTVITPFCP